MQKIDAKDISAQRRNRLYWTNIPVKPIAPKPKKLRDVLTLPGDYLDITDRFWAKRPGTLAYTKAHGSLVSLQSQERSMTTGGQSISNSGATNIQGLDGRIYTPSPQGAEVLHGLPRGYTRGPKTSRYHQIGNGWHVDVVAHIFRGLKSNFAKMFAEHIRSLTKTA